jgi:hypothetical protein
VAKKNPAKVPFEEFMGQYASPIKNFWGLERLSREGGVSLGALLPAMENGAGSGELLNLVTSHTFWDEVEHWWPIHLLRNAAEEHDSEGYKRILHLLLASLGVPPPVGVLAPWKGTAGAPKKSSTDSIVKTWETLGRPYLSRQQLARAVYGQEFSDADSKEKNRLVNQCRRAVERRVPLAQIPRPKKANEISN